MSDLFASVDLGGTNIAAVMAGEDGRILAERETPTLSHEGSTAVLNRVAMLVEELTADVGSRPAAVGVGVPGLLNFSEGLVEFMPNFPGQWRKVPVIAPLREKLGCPVHMLNDARMAALGEMAYGHGCGVDTMAFFTLGTGVGGGVVVDGRLRLGPLGAAGEIGHQTILIDGPLCGCGNRGCLETLASGPAIAAEGIRLVRSGLAPKLRAIVGGDVSAVNTRTMAEAAREGEETVRDAIVRAARYLGIGMANIVTILHPDLIVLGGGVAAIGSLLFDTVRESIQQRVGMFPPDNVEVKPSLLGDKAGALGGIALAARGGQL